MERANIPVANIDNRLWIWGEYIISTRVGLGGFYDYIYDRIFNTNFMEWVDWLVNLKFKAYTAQSDIRILAAPVESMSICDIQESFRYKH